MKNKAGKDTDISRMKNGAGKDTDIIRMKMKLERIHVSVG